MGAYPSENISMVIEETVTGTMNRYAMARPGCRVLVAVSGGVDSVALFVCLNRLAARLCLGGIGVAHLNHGLRGEAADRDAAFVETLARQYGCSFYLAERDVAAVAADSALSVEEAARNERYAFFRQIAANQGYDRIATAHHANDNAEQVLMNFIRGSGPEGLAGIPPVRKGPPDIIRPFIGIAREQISAFAAENNLTFMEDHTNEDLRFLRNRVRHDLMPRLQADYNPGMRENLNRLARVFAEEKAWLDEIVDGHLSRMLVTETPNVMTLSVDRLRQCHTAARRRVMRKAIARLKGDLRRIGFEHVAAVDEHLHHHHDFSLHLPDNVRVTRTGSAVMFSKGEPLQPQREFSYTLFMHHDEAAQPLKTALFVSEAGMRLMFDEVDRDGVGDPGTWNAGTGLFDMKKLVFPLIVRNIRPGDRFRPLGMTGTRKIKDYLIDQKVPREIRRKSAVIESGGTIIWLVGHRIADSVKITPGTRKVLKIDVVEGAKIRDDSV